jgi:uncharacterized glyoxalase superfamily protein PhnB
MSRISKITPNLVVSNVERSVAFYRDVLGFQVTTTVPEQSPLMFAIVRSGTVEVFLNAPAPAMAEYPSLAGQKIGGTFTMFMEVTGITELYEDLKPQVSVVMPLDKKWYGVTEFAFTDPDGYVITFAERR